MLPSPPAFASALRRHALVLMDPPWCHGPAPAPRIDLVLLGTRCGPGGVVLSDIPDSWENLEQALALPGVVGAVALACDGIDLWVGPRFELRLAVPLRRSTETVLARYELRSPEDAELVLSALAGRVSSGF